jgi:hypothetical protein
MKVKCKRCRNTYEYDYKAILFKTPISEQFKIRSRMEGLTYSEFLEKLLNQKVCECPTGK